MFSASIFYFLEKYISVFFIAILGFLLAKILTPNDFGMLNNAEAIIAILSIFSLQGIDQLIQRELTHKKKYINSIMYAALIIKSASIFLCTIFIIVLFIFKSDNNLIKLLTLLSPLILARGCIFFSSILIVENRYKSFFHIGAIIYTIFFILKIIFIFYLKDIYILAFLMSLEGITLSIIYYIYYRRQHSLSNKKLCFFIKQLFKEGIFLTLSSAMIIIYSKIDQIFIGSLLGYVELSQYALSSKILMLYIIPSTVFTMSYIHKLTKKNESYSKIAKDMLIKSIILGIILAIICAVTTPWLIDFLYGNKFNDAKKYILLQSILIPFSFLLNTTGRILVIEKMSKFILYRNIIALSVNIIFGFLFIKYLGAYGAIIITIICYMLSSFIFILIDKKTFFIFKRILNNEI
ncbi:oligosaccharide flippase family protein [Proteus terrae]|uniref:Wzx n=1 Tax=Proteus vulgaris TaxID=585 RepID=A0A385JMF1_PROVU|nr:oligosaccharide flippase family protein [Proteus terrae]AXY99520.1 wzx [Proteus vulgaris]MBG3090575.1 oligosaccharide flippase family protein [Proteus terrae subsp. cibarius]MCE9838549.1 oligosaccharide flippase family protein [Proteus terrae]